MIACPCHGWTYDVRTGLPDHPGGHSVSAYEAGVEGNEILVRWLNPDPEVEPIGVFVTGAFSGQFSLLFETTEGTIPTSAKFDFHNSTY